MKKMKKVLTTMLAVLMFASVGIAAGCGESAEEKAAKAKQERKAVYTDVVSSVETITTSGKAYKLGIDFDGTIYDVDIDTSAVTAETLDINGAAYMQFNKDNPLDMKIDGSISGSTKAGEETEFMYAAAYVRPDYAYYGMSPFEVEPTQADKDAIPFSKMDMQELLAMLGGITGDMGTLPTDVTTDVSSDMSTAMQPIVEQLSAVIPDILAGIGGEITTKSGTTTLKVDIKKAIDNIYQSANAAVDSIQTTTKISDLLKNENVKALYNQFLGDVSAEQIKTLLGGVIAAGGAMALPETEGKSGYDYLLGIFESNPMLDMPMITYKAQAKEVLAEVKTALDAINALNFSISVKNKLLSGISVNVDITNAAKVSFSMTLAEVTYTFADVTKLNVVEAPADPEISLE